MLSVTLTQYPSHQHSPLTMRLGVLLQQQHQEDTPPPTAADMYVPAGPVWGREWPFFLEDNTRLLLKRVPSGTCLRSQAHPGWPPAQLHCSPCDLAVLEVASLLAKVGDRI